MAKVLCVSFDEVVSQRRAEMLGRLGWSVTATLHPDEAIRLLSFEKFDAVVVGHRFPRTERHHIAETAQRKKTPVVLVCGASPDGDIPATLRVFALEGLGGLEAAMHNLMPMGTSA